MTPKIEKLTEIGSVELGEGPHWDAQTQSLYFVDVFGQYIHKYVPSTKKHTKAHVGKNVSFIIPVEGKDDQFVVAIDTEIALITWDGESEKISNVKVLYGNENTETVFNDGKCDPSGRLWTGTYGKIVEGHGFGNRDGSFFSFQNNKITKHLSNIGISNGLAFDAKSKKLYYIDSLNRTLDQYDFDIKNGTISNGKPIFTLKEGKIENLQVLDGMTIDADGNLWVALVNLSKIIKIDPRKPETIASTIHLPANKVTSLAFGGPNLDELYVTSGRFEAKGVASANSDDGLIYRVTGLNTKGLPGVRAVL